MTNKELEKLILCLQEGGAEGAAFDVLYESTYRMLYSISLGVLKDYSLAEDALQETYIRLLSGIGNYRMGNNAYGYLVSICRNVCYNILRKRREETLVDIADNEALFGDYRIEDSSLYRTEITSYLDVLSEEERQIVLLKVYGGYKHKEIAQAIGKPIGTVLWLYRRAVGKMKSMLSEEEDTEIQQKASQSKKGKRR